MNAALKDISTDDLLAEIKARMESADAVGFKRGQQAAAGQFMVMATQLGAPTTVSIPTSFIGGAGLPASPSRPGENSVTRAMREFHGVKAAARAPRGQVADAIEEVLASTPGLRIVEVVDRVMETQSGIIPKSIANALHRGEKLGVYERHGKYAWYLKGQASQQETAATEKVTAADLYR